MISGRLSLTASNSRFCSRYHSTAFDQGFPRTASPENEFIAITFPFLEIFNTSERKVYIPGFVAQCLIDIKKEQDEVKEALGSEYTDYNLIMAKTMKV